MEKVRKFSEHPESAGRLAAVLAVIQRSQVAIAEMLNISPQYLSQLKTGARQLSEPVALKMEHVFGVSARWLLEAEGEIFVDGEKAARYVEFERPQAGVTSVELHYRDAEGKLRRIVARVPSRGSSGSEARQESVSLPLLAAPAKGRPEASEEFRGIYVKAPSPAGSDCYCLRADLRCPAVFREDEFVLVANKPGHGWRVEEVDGKVCIARVGDEEQLQFYRLRSCPAARVDEVEVALLGEGKEKAKVVAWNDVSIIGVVLMAFRTHFPVSASQQTDSSPERSHEP